LLQEVFCTHWALAILVLKAKIKSNFFIKYNNLIYPKNIKINFGLQVIV
jgi:hypothetical protein